MERESGRQDRANAQTRLRLFLLAASWVLIGGSLAADGWYAGRLNSDSYRRELEAELTAFFEMPVRFERLVPLRLDRTALRNVELVLPDSGERVFHCRRAEWVAVNGPDGFGFELWVRNGGLELPGRALGKEDYAQLLRRGLAHNFAELNLRTVYLEGIDLAWKDDGFALRAGRAHGRITFPHERLGVADLRSERLNGAVTSDPLSIRARFDPSNGLRMQEVTVEVPKVHLADLQLDSLAGAPLRSGSFQGRLRIRAEGNANVYELSGRVDDLLLEEMTSRLRGGPVHGRLKVELERARLAGRHLAELRLSGSADGLSLVDISRVGRWLTVEGHADLEIYDLVWTRRGLQRLVASGRAEGLDAGQIVRALGYEGVSGRLDAEVDYLLWQGGKLVRADARLQSVTTDGVAQTIDQGVVARVLKQLPAGKLTRLLLKTLPEKIAYHNFGARVEVRDNVMRVVGERGPTQDAILTVMVAGKEIALLKSLPNRIQLGPWIRSLRKQWATIGLDRLRTRVGRSIRSD